VAHPIVASGTVWHSYAKVHEPIELSFGVVSGVGPGIGVLDGGPCAQRGSGGLRGFSPSLVEWQFFSGIVKTEMYLTRE